MNRILIDGDGCPVIYLTNQISNEYEIEMIVVADHNHLYNELDCQIKYVDQGSNHADLYIVNMLEKDDLLLTQDLGLITLALSKNCNCMDYYGNLYSKNNINELIFKTNNTAFSKKNNKFIKQKKRTSKDDQKFVESLINYIEEH